MPALVQSPTFLQRGKHFFLDLAFGPVLRRENKRSFSADRFLGAPAKDLFGPRAPEGDDVVRIEQKHRVIRRALDEELETLVAFAQGGLGALELVDIGGGAEPAHHATVSAAQRHIAPDEPAIFTVARPQAVLR